MEVGEETRLQAAAEEDAKLKSKAERDAESTSKMAYKKATVDGPYISRKISNRDNPLKGYVAVRQSEVAIAGPLSTTKP